MKHFTNKLEAFLGLGGTKKDIVLLIISGAFLLLSILDLLPLPFDAAWIAIILCGVPIILEAFIGLVTAFDIKADVLVSLALIASVCIGEDFAAGEVAFIMQLGGLLEELTVAKARAGIEKLVKLTPRTARILTADGEKTVPAEVLSLKIKFRILLKNVNLTAGLLLILHIRIWALRWRRQSIFPCRYAWEVWLSRCLRRQGRKVTEEKISQPC